MNAILSIILVISTIIYTMTSPAGGDSSFKWVLYVCMILLPINLLSTKSINIEYKSIMSKWLICFTVFFLFHIIFANEKPLNDFILLISFFSLSTVAVSPNLGRPVFLCLLTLFIIELIFTFALDIRQIGIGTAWVGLFQNANTNSIFICSTLIATLLFCPNRKVRLSILAISLIAIIATRSRNALFVYLFIVGGFLFEYKLKKYQKYLPLILGLILILAGYYMIVIEPSTKQHTLEMFGKDQGSAGRSMQLLYLVKNYKILLWGNGRVINSIIEKHTEYPVHNVYLASFYMLGIVISTAYIAFILWIYYKSNSFKFKICLLAYQFYIFFEPGYFLSVQLFSYLPLFVLCCGFFQQSKFCECEYDIPPENIPRLLNNV